MKKRKPTLKIFLIIIIALGFFCYIFYVHEPSIPKITGDAVSIPNDCSESNIKATWDSIFKESSDNINISSSEAGSGKCSYFTAFKIKNNNELYILVGMDTNLWGFNRTAYSAQYMNFTPNYFNSSNFPLLEMNMNNLTKRNLESSNLAATEFSNYFKIVPTTWRMDVSFEESRFIFNETSNISGVLTEQIGGVEINYSICFFSFSKEAYSQNNSSRGELGAACTTSDWASNITPEECPESQKQIRTWTKTRTCNETSGINKPSSENISCVYDPSSVICKNFTYSNWSECLSDGKQTRYMIMALPAGCKGGTLNLTQTCDSSNNNTDSTTDSIINSTLTNNSPNKTTNSTDVKKQSGTTKVFFVKFICKLSNLFNQKNYQSCLGKYIS